MAPFRRSLSSSENSKPRVWREWAIEWWTRRPSRLAFVSSGRVSQAVRMSANSVSAATSGTTSAASIE